ncbi:hypothetical protein IGJ02_000140 [Enterococcus sp. DIV0724b]|uniref:MucBP domain-containing protein n=1 Tax=Enterococcus sp. DIV0724b TaxID=2774694 RepID=UPI003D2FC0E4
MDSRKKIKLWGIISLAILGIGAANIVFGQTTPISAETGKNIKGIENSKSTSKTSVNPTDSFNALTKKDAQARALDPVENAEGLKATPKVLKLAKDAVFPDITTETGLKLLFSSRVIPNPTAGATYAYVKEDGSPLIPDSTKVGFQKIYVEITENTNHSSIRVPIPVTITDAGTSLAFNNLVAVQTENIEGKILFYPQDTKDKTAEELQELVKAKAKAQAWNMETGEAVSVELTQTTIDASSVGTYKAQYEVTMDSQKQVVQKDVIIFGANPKAYVSIAKDDPLPLSENPTNLFGKFQTIKSASGKNARYQFVDEKGEALSAFDTSEVGFHWAYVKMTEATNENISTIVKVPINVTKKGETTALLTNQVMVQADEKTLLYPDDTKGKNEGELAALIQSKAHLRAWNMSTGESVPVSFTTSTINNNSVGTYTGTIQVELNGEVATTTRKAVVFGANPKVVSIEENGELTLGTNPTNLLSKFQTVDNTTATNATYQLVDGKGEALSDFDTSEVGFHWAHVKMTDKVYPTVSTTIKVPINVTRKGETTALLTNQVMVQADEKTLLYPDDTKGKNEGELAALIQSKAHLRAWNMSTGESVPASFTTSTINNNSVGTYTGTIQVELNGEVATTTRKAVVFGANPKVVSIEENGELTLGTNPTNLLSKFQTVDNTTATNATYQLVDGKGEALSDFDTSEVGFHWAHVKMTDKVYPTVSTTIKVPINVTRKGETTALLTNQVMVQADEKTLLYPDDTKDKNKEELLDLIQSKAHLRAWNMSTGESVPTSFTTSTIKNNSVGTYTGTIQVELNGEKGVTIREFIVFGANLKSAYFTIKQGETLEMGSDGNKIFKKYQTTGSSESKNAVYEWVADKEGHPTEPVNTYDYDSSKIGFHWGYIKMTDRAVPEVSTVIPIPVTVTPITDEKKIEFLENKFALEYNPAIEWISPGQLKGKTPAQIQEYIKNYLSLKVWELSSGEEPDVKLEIPTINENSVGSYNLEITLTTEQSPVSKSIAMLIFQKFPSGEENGWQEIDAGSTEGIITNPVNGSTLKLAGSGQAGFRIYDQSNANYVFSSALVNPIPAIDQRPVYLDGSETIHWGADLGVVSQSANFQKYFYKKENEIRQFLVDRKNQIVYVYKLSLNRNLNFSVQLEMHNLLDITRHFSMLESVDLDYLNDSVPVYSLGDNSGFYMEPEQGKRFTIKLKDAQGNWLSDYRKYHVSDWSSYVYPGKNYFGKDFSRDGMESKNYKQGKVLLRDKDSAYQLGAPGKNIESGKVFKTGYEVFAGEELPYMKLKADPESFNVYSDSKAEFKTDYTLSQIPTENDQGTIYATYPDGSEEKIPFSANSLKEFEGTLAIPRNTLPDKLNEVPGTIKKYNTSLLAIDETEGPMKGLPSEEYAIQINVYNLGGTPIAQTIKKGSAWEKEASSLIKNPVVLPDHTATFEYVNSAQPVDTSKVGLQYAEVRMTDINEPSQTTVIKVPVMVVEDTPPTTGLIIGAHDFTIKKNDVADLSTEQINTLILEKSEAKGWDVETGLTEGVELTVIDTTLTNTPEVGETYSAVIQAKKGTNQETESIQIKIDPTIKSSLTVNFVDEKGNPLHKPYKELQEVNAVVDLTKMTEITEVVSQLRDAHYDLVKRPDNEVITISEGENLVTYQFKGSLQLLSSPDVLDFELQKATINAVKFTDPKIIGQPLVVSDTRADKMTWDLKAKIDQPLTSLEDDEAKMPGSIKYKYEDDELTLTDESIVIFSHLNAVSGSYNVTEERWSKGDGFLLDLAPGAIKALGKYQAKITIALENAK